jgi:hypothetical protein
MIRLLLCILLLASTAQAESLTISNRPPTITIVSTPDLFDSCGALPPLAAVEGTFKPFPPGADWPFYFERYTVEGVDLNGLEITAWFRSDEPGWFMADYAATIIERQNNTTGVITLVSWDPSYSYNGKSLPFPWAYFPRPVREGYGYPSGTVVSTSVYTEGVTQIEWAIYVKAAYLDYGEYAVRPALYLLMSKELVGDVLNLTIPAADTSQLWAGTIYFSFHDPTGTTRDFSRAFSFTPTPAYTRY